MNKIPNWIDVTVEWLDTKFVIPNTKIRFGLDPIFSLFPVLGDFVTYFIGVLMIYTIRRKGASGELMLRMMINSSVDAFLGMIPLVGTFFDVGYRSNLKNLKLMKAYYEEGKYQSEGKYLLMLVITLFILTTIGIFYLFFLLIEKLINYGQSL